MRITLEMLEIVLDQEGDLIDDLIDAVLMRLADFYSACEVGDSQEHIHTNTVISDMPRNTIVAVVSGAFFKCLEETLSNQTGDALCQFVEDSGVPFQEHSG